MKKIILSVKANIKKNKGASISLFVIIMIVSMLMTVGLSVMLGVSHDYAKSLDRLSSLHSAFVLEKGMYNPSFEDVIKEDARVSQYEISEALFSNSDSVKLNYGGVMDFGVIILNFDTPMEVSAPMDIELDGSVPKETAICLPAYAKGLGYATGDTFTIIYKNKPIDLTIAGFFETNELSTPNMGLSLKIFASAECFEALKQHFDSSFFIAVRFFDIHDSESFNNDFASKIDIELPKFNFSIYADSLAMSVLTPVTIVSTILIVFALAIALISLFVIRFRVSSKIEDTMHEIGVMKASGYTSAQIVACYIMEYAAISFPAALIGVLISMPISPIIRQSILAYMTGTAWTLGMNMETGLIAALLLVGILLMMVHRSCRKIKKLPPVTALRGGIATNSFRRNFFPLQQGIGNVQMRLGLKNMFAFIKTYAMIGVVIAGITLSAICIAGLYQGFVLDQVTFAKMAGLEVADIMLDVTRHTDADALAAELEKMPEVRKTSMLDMGLSGLSFEIDGILAIGNLSNDYERLESMRAHDGRMPKYDNEITLPKIFADELGKVMGDSVKVHANGVTQEYIITGFFSTTNNGGRVAAITLEGYQRLDPSSRLGTIYIYLNGEVTIDEFSEKLKQDFGVLNVYKQNENSEFAAAKARAEEKISTYLEQHDIDSVEYAVIYNGDIILSGSSGEYQIEKITDTREFLRTNIGAYSGVIMILTQFVAVISLLIISLILFMTVRTIITKRRRELGILKACGFTTKQLARQLAISFLPAAFIGVLIGCVIGSQAINPALSVMLASSGVYGTSFGIAPLFVFLIGAVILLAAFMVANLSAMRIKNISVYELISE